MDKLAAGMIGISQEELVLTKLFIPNSVPTRDVLDFIVATGRPVQGVLAFEDGFEISVPISANQQGRVLPKATRYGLVIGGRQHYSLGATTDVIPEELVKLSVNDLSAWLADHELAIKDYEAILAAEMAGKKRSSVVKELKALM